MFARSERARTSRAKGQLEMKTRIIFIKRYIRAEWRVNSSFCFSFKLEKKDLIGFSCDLTRPSAQRGESDDRCLISWIFACFSFWPSWSIFWKNNHNLCLLISCKIISTGTKSKTYCCLNNFLARKIEGKIWWIPLWEWFCRWSWKYVPKSYSDILRHQKALSRTPRILWSPGRSWYSARVSGHWDKGQEVAGHARMRWRKADLNRPRSLNFWMKNVPNK